MGPLPEPDDLELSIEILFMAVLGGVASTMGAVIGVVLFLRIREALFDVVPYVVGHEAAPQYELIIFGLLITGILILRPGRVGPSDDFFDPVDAATD